MRSVAVVWLSACLGLAGPLGAPSRAQEFSDEAVEKAIAKGVRYLWSKQTRDGHWPGFNQYPVGPTALVCYALLESGVNPQRPQMARALAWLTRSKTDKTYSLALRCNVWEVANRSTQGKYRMFLARDAKQLWSTSPAGAYDYDSVPKKIQKRWDNSNSQFGLLGVWAASLGNAEAPVQYWRTVWTHWASHQFPDGTWGYQADPRSKRPTMTVGGVASLFICFDHVFAQQFIKCQGGQYAAPIQKGLDWLDQHFRRTMGGAPDYYYYYGVERVALASGYKYFGKADWYKLGATNLIRAQRPDGSWPAQWSELVSTSFALLYLIRGRHAVMFNKLEYDGFWNNRPRDLAHLTRWMSYTFERTVNWQIINLKVPVSEWHDAPILYIAGSKAPNFSEQDLAKLREFVLQGGAIFSVGECEDKAFAEAMRQTYKKLFPGHKLVECPPDHEIYTRRVHFDLPAGKPKMYVLSNGVRPLALHTDEDLSINWQGRRWKTRTHTFGIAANVVKYVTGSVATLRHRGTTHWVQPPGGKPRGTVRLARVQHHANWDPEPLAYVRFGRMLARDTGLKLEVLPPVEIRELPKTDAPIATLTGTGALKFYDSHAAAIRKYVEGGGTLVIDCAGGSKEFAESMRENLRTAFPKRPLRRLSSSFPMYHLAGMTLDKVRYRFETDVRLGRMRTPNLQAVTVDGRPAVLFSREDITAGLVGYPSYTVDGYEPESAYALLRNIFVYAGKRARRPENPLNAVPGLQFTYFDSKFTAVHTGTTRTFDLADQKHDGQFALKLTGFLDVPRDGAYTFYLGSDGAAKFHLGDEELIGTDPGKAAEAKSEPIDLRAGKHAVTCTAFCVKGSGALRVSWQGPGIQKQEIPASALYHAGP